MVSVYASTFVVVVIWGILAVCCVTARGVTVSQGPENVVVREGETAVMTCTFDGRKGRDRVRWYRVEADGVPTAISLNQEIESGAAPTAGVYFITGDRRNGEYNLKITRVNRRDSGEYMCGFETGPRNDVTSEGAWLRVVVPPDVTSPLCSIVPDGRDSSTSIPGYYAVGETVQMRCISSGGEPSATLRWKRGPTYLTQETTGRAILERVLEMSDLDQEFTCYADSVALPTPRPCSLVPARRRPNVRISPETASVPVDGGITFACVAEGAVPTSDSRYRWFVNGNEVLDNGRSQPRFRVSDDTGTLTVQRVRGSDDGAVVRCELSIVAGTLGRAEATVRVTGVQRTSNSLTTNMPTMTSLSSPMKSASSTPTEATKTNPSLTGSDEANHEMPTELIIVSAVAGIAIGALAVILILYLFKKHRKRQARKADQQQQQGPTPPGSTPMITKPAMAVQPVLRRDLNGVQQSEDGYTVLAKPNTYRGRDLEKSGNSGIYEVVENAPVPKPDSGANDLDWDYDIPYSQDHTKRQAMDASNPVYLEIIQ